MSPIAHKPEPDALRTRLLSALAASREPGFHLPGYFLQMKWPHMAGRTAVQAMSSGEHCVDATGAAHPAVVGILVDGALSMAPRLVIEPGARMATVHMDIQYTGRAARDALSAEATLEGFFESG